MVSVQGWPVVSPSDPIAPVSPEPMAATTWVDDLTTMPAEIPVKASTAELDLARADPTAGLFPSTADLKAQDQGAQQVAPVDAPAPAQAKAKGCGGTRIWDGKVCREPSVKPAAAAASKLDVAVAPKPKSKCGPDKIWDGKVCRPPKGPKPAPVPADTPSAPVDTSKQERDAKRARAKEERDAKRAKEKEEKRKREARNKRPKKKDCSRDKTWDATENACRPKCGSGKKYDRVTKTCVLKSACSLGDTTKYVYETRVESRPGAYDWKCPLGYTDTGCDWGIGPNAPNEIRHCRKAISSGGTVPAPAAAPAAAPAPACPEKKFVEVTFYDDTGYNGRPLGYGRMPATGRSEADNEKLLKQLAGGLAKFSSVKIDPGLKVTAYQGYNYEMRSVELTGHIPNLGVAPYFMNDQVKSIKISCV